MALVSKNTSLNSRSCKNLRALRKCEEYQKIADKISLRGIEGLFAVYDRVMKRNLQVYDPIWCKRMIIYNVLFEVVKSFESMNNFRWGLIRFLLD